MNLEWPTKNIFKYAYQKKEEIEKDYMIIKAENTINKKIDKNDKSDDLGR